MVEAVWWEASKFDGVDGWRWQFQGHLISRSSTRDRRCLGSVCKFKHLRAIEETWEKSWYCFGPIYLLIYWSTSLLVSITSQTSEPLQLWLSCRCVCCFCKYSICNAVSKTMAAISPSETSSGSGESKNGSGSELHAPKRLEHAARLALAISRASNPQVVDKGSALLGICVRVQTRKGQRRNVRKISRYCFGPIYLLTYWSTSLLVSITPQTSEPLRLWLSWKEALECSSRSEWSQQDTADATKLLRVLGNSLAGCARKGTNWHANDGLNILIRNLMTLSP